MATVEHYIQAIRKVVVAATGMSANNVFVNFDDRPADNYPVDTYATVHIKEIRNWGKPKWKDVTSSFGIVNSTRVTSVILTGVINFYLDGATNLQSLMEQCEWDDDVVAVMWSEDIGIRKVTASENTTGLISANQEERGKVTIEFYAELANLKKVFTIESVNFAVDDEQDNNLTNGGIS
jgi:hypothetical protein